MEVFKELFQKVNNFVKQQKCSIQSLKSGIDLPKLVNLCHKYSMKYKKFNLTLFFSIVFLFNAFAFSQEEYKASPKNPFGKLNPSASKEVADYADLIGISDCKSRQRGKDGKFKTAVNSVWQFKYVMNGTAVQDESWKSDGSHTTSIRQFDNKKSQWHVTFFSKNSPSPTPSTWSGGTNKKGDIVLKRPQKAPNGMEGFSKLTFHEISKKSFKWKGEWVDKSEKIVFPFWRIECKKRK